ncbi:acyl-CoA dehydrogenase family protein [Streptomyces tendae]|uniref:hydrolase n=1 Tax=Streptomyces tendae TaxID=1932 RepID=UPI003710DD49
MLDVEELAMRARASASRTEKAGKLDSEIARLIPAAGFARHFVPSRFEGAAGSFAELTRAVATVSASCPATGWCASLAANLARMVRFLPEEGQREIWGEGPDALVVGSLASFGKAEPTADGWLLTGRWPFISGVDHADWALLCAGLPDGQPARVFAVRRAELTPGDTWDSIGMRGTGSHHVHVDGVFVPRTRTFARDEVVAGRPAGAAPEDHTVPLEAVNLLSFAAPLLGTAEGALAVWTEHARNKAANWNPAAPSASLLATTYARTGGEIDAARLLLERCADVADRGPAVTEAEVARNIRDISLSVEMLTAAVNRLVARGGTSNFGESKPLQRFWRDANTTASHVALQFEMAALGYAEGRLWEPGKAPGSMPLDADW